MTNPMITILNCETNEVTDRPMTNAEHEDYKAIMADRARMDNEAKAKETAKVELLSKLGITAEEAALLLG
jgi:hypothetical protein